MCGIAGYLTPLPADERAAAVGRMLAALRHRGPDDDGLAAAEGVTLGMRRLAIFDPAHGHQPMRTADGRFTIVFNGAIYNFRALRAELAQTGAAFRTECDTEVLLAAFARWGAACLPRLRGMFAFAVWDERERSLFLARDAFGIKPLYLHRRGDTLLFASELRALVASRACPIDPDPQGVADYLAWLAIPAPRTIYREIQSLRAGECATFRAGQLTLSRWWRFARADTAGADTGARSREEFSRELLARLRDTIRAHSIADVPVGAFLSGGLDSAAIVALMREAGTGPLKTFSIGFEEPDYSEADVAAETARFLGTQHATRVLTGREVAADLPRLIDALDQPTGDGINTFYASAAARAGGVKVALSGLGGDELFGGYPSFRDVPRLRRWLPLWRAVPRAAREAVHARLAAGSTRQRKLADTLRHARSTHEVSALQRRVFSETTRAALLTPAAGADADGPFHPELAALAAELPDAGSAETVSAWEMRGYMADVLLRDSDVMSMQHSLELRVPFVDVELVRWLWQQPAALRITLGAPKSALYAAVAPLVPPALATRRKRGFSLPFPLWMKRELRPFLDETFSAASVARARFFDVPAVAACWRGFLEGNDSREWSRVWSLAMAITFLNRGPRA